MSISTKSILSAMNAAPELKLLSQRIALAERRLACARKALPASLASQISSGGCEDASWCILVPNSAVATKIRHLLPPIHAALREEEGHLIEIRVRIANT